MDRVCMVRDLVAELLWAKFAMGRVCHGPRLLWAEMFRNRHGQLDTSYIL